MGVGAGAGCLFNIKTTPMSETYGPAGARGRDVSQRVIIHFSTSLESLPFENLRARPRSDYQPLSSFARTPGSAHNVIRVQPRGAACASPFGEAIHVQEDPVLKFYSLERDALWCSSAASHSARSQHASSTCRLRERIMGSCARCVSLWTGEIPLPEAVCGKWRFGAIGLQQQSPASSGGDHLLAAAVARELKQRAGEESGDCGRDDCQD